MRSLREIAEQACHEIEVPDVIGERCVHSFMETAQCRSCVDACPRNAWVIDDATLGIDMHQCDGCGLCIPACPQGAVVQSHEMALKDWHEQKLALCACEKTGLEAGVGVIPCVHVFGLNDLLHLHRSGVQRILYASDDCDRCARGSGVRLQNRLADLNRSLIHEGLPELPSARLTADVWHSVMAETVQENTGPRLSRRNFFRNLARTGLHEGMKHAGLSEENDDDFTPPGRLFVATSSDTLRPFVPEIAAERCNGCDACIRLCPHQALVFVGAGDGECYEIHPENCSGCKVCVDVCEQDAITLNVWKSSQQDKVSLQYGRCTACGASFHIPEVQSMVENRQRCRICSQHNHYQNLYQVLEQ